MDNFQVISIGAKIKKIQQMSIYFVANKAEGHIYRNFLYGFVKNTKAERRIQYSLRTLFHYPSRHQPGNGGRCKELSVFPSVRKRGNGLVLQLTHL